MKNSESVTPLELVTEALEIPDVFLKVDWKKLNQDDDLVLLEASKWLKTTF